MRTWPTRAPCCALCRERVGASGGRPTTHGCRARWARMASCSPRGEMCASSGTLMSSQNLRDSRRFATVEARKSPPNEEESPILAVRAAPRAIDAHSRSFSALRIGVGRRQKKLLFFPCDPSRAISIPPRCLDEPGPTGEHGRKTQQGEGDERDPPGHPKTPSERGERPPRPPYDVDGVWPGLFSCICPRAGAAIPACGPRISAGVRMAGDAAQPAQPRSKQERGMRPPLGAPKAISPARDDFRMESHPRSSTEPQFFRGK